MNKWNKNYIRIGIVFTISVCICITFNELLQGWRTILALVGALLSALAPVIIGIVIAFLLNPIMGYIQTGLSRIIKKIQPKVDIKTAYSKAKVPSLIITIVFFLAILTGFIWLVVPSVYRSLEDLVTSMPTYIENAQKWVEDKFSSNQWLEEKFSGAIGYVQDNVMGVLQDRIMPNLDTIVVQISTGIVAGLKIVLNFFVGLIIAVFLLANKQSLLAQGRKILYCMFSRKNGNKIMRGLSYANSVFGGFINGKILDSLIIGIICFIFTQSIGMKYAVLISVIVGVTNIIPFFGPFIGAVPGALLALMDSPIMLLIFVIFILVLQQVDGNIIGPLILGDSTGLSSIWVLVAILVGGSLFGVWGMLLGVPVFACIYTFLAISLRDKLREKKMSSRTEDYYNLSSIDEETGEFVYSTEQKRKKIGKEKKRFNKKRKNSSENNDKDNTKFDSKSKE